MRRANGYSVGTEGRDHWDENATSDYSQDDSPRTQASRSDLTNQQTLSSLRTPRTADSGRASSVLRNTQPSGIPRANAITPSRLPSALKTPRSRSYSSSSSADSYVPNEDIPPPVPHVPAARGRAPSVKTHQDIATNYSGTPQLHPKPSLSRRATSTSRSRSRFYAQSEGTKLNPSHPPPSQTNSDMRKSDAPSTKVQDHETPKTNSWAKDRRRLVNPDSSKFDYVTSRTGEFKYEHPPISTPSGRNNYLDPKVSSSIAGGASQTPSRSRIPSATTRPSWAPVEEPFSSDVEIKTRVSSRSGSTRSGRSDTSRPKPSQYHHSQRREESLHPENVELPRAKAMSNTISRESQLSRGKNRYSTIDSKVKTQNIGESNELDIVHISSMQDTPLPLPPLPQPDPTSKSCGIRDISSGEVTRSGTISSPLETLLMGSDPRTETNTGQGTKRISTPVRMGRESLTHATIAPGTPCAPRPSTQLPNNETGSARALAKDKLSKEHETPPTILQRLARRASFSTGKTPKVISGTSKSPKSCGTPKSQIGVDHYEAESPFGLEIETPRATAEIAKGSSGFGSGWSAGGALQHDSSSHQKEPLAIPTTTDLEKKPRSRAVDEVSRFQNDLSKLGSPFMGDGSPRFGIDERFKSPKVKSRSGLRRGALEDSHEEVPQELLDYYAENQVVSNTEDYLAEETPIATILSSPRDLRPTATRHSVPPSPVVQGKKRTQYSCLGRARAERNDQTFVEDESCNQAPATSSRTQTPRVHNPAHVSFSSAAPDTIRAISRNSSDSSVRSRFSDSPEEKDVVPQSVNLEEPRKGSRGVHSQRPVPPAMLRARHCKKTPERKVAEDAYKQHHSSKLQPQLSRPSPKSSNSHNLDSQIDIVTPDMNEPSHRSNSSGRSKGDDSQLPVSKNRNTNSALFRALEQPYESSPFSSRGPTDSSLSSMQTDYGDGPEDTEYLLTDEATERPYTASSSLSSLNGDGVGDIRWSGTHELSNATDVLLQNIKSLDPEAGHPRVVIEEPSETYASDVIDDGGGEDSTYSDEECTRDEPYQSSYPYGSSVQLPEPTMRHRNNRMSIQGKRKAVHELWRANLGGNQLAALEAIYDPMELQRQQVIWQFYESEEAFVDTLETILRLFVQPLRAQHQRRWISGLFPDVMRLFDWLDDIANLHKQLLAALDLLQQDQHPVTIRFSETIRSFVPLMELYQPYVVRVEQVSGRIAAMVLDPDSDFGEFVRMQSVLPECGQESLEDMLGKPPKRLEYYVDIFQKLLALTPRAHADYLATFSLLHSMHVVTCVIQEVKSQEQEYEFIKSLLDRVQGLPSGFKIGTRGRHLLTQGLLQQIHIRDGQLDRPSLPADLRQFESSSIIGRARSYSQSTATSITDSTSSSYRSTSSTTTHLKDSATEYDMRSDSSATSYTHASFDGHRTQKLPFLPHAGVAPPPRASRSRPSKSKAEQSDIYVLVFADLVLLTQPITEAIYPSRSPRKILPRGEQSTSDAIGVFRVLGVEDCSKQHGYPCLIRLDLVPLDGSAHTINPVNSPLYLSVSGSGKSHKIQSEDSGVHEAWFQSFKKCYLHTLRYLSFATSPGAFATKVPQDGMRNSMDSSAVDILAGDLNFPKSPSQQLERAVHLKETSLPPVDNTEEEREEREFWAVRFKSVYQDMRRTYEGIIMPTHLEIHQPSVPQYNAPGPRHSSGTMF